MPPKRIVNARKSSNGCAESWSRSIWNLIREKGALDYGDQISDFMKTLLSEGKQGNWALHRFPIISPVTIPDDNFVSNRHISSSPWLQDVHPGFIHG